MPLRYLVWIEKCSVPEDNQMFAKAYEEFFVLTEVFYGECGAFSPCVPGRSLGTMKAVLPTRFSEEPNE